MPWKTSDVDRFKKGLSDKDKERWVAIANDVLARCIEDGGDQAECERAAIMQASGAVEEQEAENMPDELENVETPGAESAYTEYIGGLEDYMRQIRGAFERTFQPQTATAVPAAPSYLWVKDIYSDHPQLGDAVVVDDHPQLGDAVVVEDNGLLFAVPYALDEDGAIRFGGRDEWEQVIPTYVKISTRQEPQGTEAAETELAESASGHVISLAEQLPLPGAEKVVPLHLDVALITPGWGNKRDNHYYPRDVVERDSGVFAGVKMYETDHRQDEKSTRTWVSTVKEITGYTDDGAPVGRISVHDKNFAERLMALAADDLLEKMECSILANGTARKGEVDGKKGHIVEAITSAESVDWVTRAGAGGRALSLAESESGGESMDEEKTDAIAEQESEPTEEPLEEVTLQEQQEPEEQPPAPARLEPEKVQQMVEATNLPDAAKTKLSEAEYADEEAVNAAVAGEVAYIKEVTGSGKPFAQGAGSAPEKRPRTAEESDADWKRILTEVGMPYLAGGD